MILNKQIAYNNFSNILLRMMTLKNSRDDYTIRSKCKKALDIGGFDSELMHSAQTFINAPGANIYFVYYDNNDFYVLVSANSDTKDIFIIAAPLADCNIYEISKAHDILEDIIRSSLSFLNGGNVSENISKNCHYKDKIKDLSSNNDNIIESLVIYNLYKAYCSIGYSEPAEQFIKDKLNLNANEFDKMVSMYSNFN